MVLKIIAVYPECESVAFKSEVLQCDLESGLIYRKRYLESEFSPVLSNLTVVLVNFVERKNHALLSPWSTRLYQREKEGELMPFVYYEPCTVLWALLTWVFNSHKSFVSGMLFSLFCRKKMLREQIILFFF